MGSLFSFCKKEKISIYEHIDRPNFDSDVMCLYEEIISNSSSDDNDTIRFSKMYNY